MQTPLDTYDDPLLPMTNRILPDITEIPLEDNHDRRVYYKCHTSRTGHPGDYQLPNSKGTSSSMPTMSKEPNRTLLTSPNYTYESDSKGISSSVPTMSKEPNRTMLMSSSHIYDPNSKGTYSFSVPNMSIEPSRTVLRSPNHCVNHSRTQTLGTARFVLTVLVPCAAFMVTLSMAYILISSSHAQAHLLERVASLEERLSEVVKSCKCGTATEGESGQSGFAIGERRENKFAFLMARGHGNVLGGETESKPGEDLHSLHELHPLHELKEVLETVTPEIHPKVLIKLEEARSISSSSEESDSSNPASLDDTRASPKRMPVISQGSESGRVKRGSKKRGRDRNQSEEQVQRGRVAGAGTGTRDAAAADRNSTEIRGVHFQANLNRTTTIGVGEAGWVPYWALSSSLLNAGSAGYMDEIKREFRLSARGNVTVRTPGLYYVYSQMMYYDPNEYIGHSIVIDGVEAFTCIAPISEQTSKYKTCFIGGLVYIPPRAKVAIKMLYTPRRVCLFEDTSYFGMFRVT